MESNSLVKSKDSFEIIDLTKFILAFFVVAIHTHPLENCKVAIINNIYEFVVLCAVPIFFMSSGYLLMNKVSKSQTEQINGSMESVLSKSLKKMIRLYLIWTAAYLPITVYHYYSEGFTVTEAIVDFIKGFVFVGEHYNSWILWYILSSIYALIFILILNRFKLSIKAITAIGFVFFIGGCFINAFVAYNGSLPNILIAVQNIISSTIVNGRIFRGFLYIPLGMLFATKKTGRQLALTVAAIGFVIGIIGEYTITTLSDIAIAFFAFGIFSFLITISLKPSPIYFKLRKMSTVIYFIHLYVLSFFEFLVFHEKRLGFLLFAIVSVISLLISVAYVEIKYKKIK